MPQTVRFDDYVLDPEAGLLTGPDGPIRLRPRTFQLLVALVEAAPGVATHEVLLDQVWQADHVSTAALTQAISELRAALEDSSSAPRCIETVHRRGYRFKAGLRVESEVDGTEVTSEPAGAARRWLWPWMRAAAVGAAALGLLLLASQRSQPQPPVQPRRLVVLDFAAAPELPAWLGPGMAELVRLELRARTNVPVASGEQITRARLELGAEPEDAASQGHLLQALDAGIVVTGSAEASDLAPDGIRLRLVPPGSTEIVVSGRREDLPSLASEAAVAVAAAVGRPIVAEPPSTALPMDMHSLEGFFLGLEALRSFHPRAARDHLLPVVEASPSSPLARWALARAWLDLGWEDPAREQMLAAQSLATGLPPRLRLPIAALAAELDGDWVAVAEKYQALATLFPSEPAYGLRGVDAQIRAGRLDDATRHLGDLVAVSGATAALRVDLANARLAGAQAREDDRLVLARAVAARADASGQRGIQAEALEQIGLSHAHRGAGAEAVAAYDAAAELFAAYGNTWRAAITEHLAAEALIRAGHYEAATLRLGQVRSTMEVLENPQGRVRWRVTQARLFQFRQELELARPLYDEAEALCRESGFRAGLALVLVDQAALSQHRGESDAAITGLDEAIALYRELGNERGQAAAEANRGAYLLQAGRGLEARPVLQSALQTFQQLAYPAEFNVLENLGTLERRWGDPEQARALLNQALEGYQAVGRQPKVAQGLLSLGELELELGDVDAARMSFSRSATTYRRLDQPIGRARAMSRLVVTLLSAGNVEKAQARCRRIEKLEPSLQDPSSRAVVAVARAELSAALGDWREVQAHAAQALAAASESGQVLELADLRLDVARWALARGELTTARREAETALAAFRPAADRRGEAEAELVLAELELARGAPAAASAHLERSRDMVTAAPFAERHRLAEAALALAAKRTEDALKGAREVAAKARQRGAWPLIFKAELLESQAMDLLGKHTEAKIIRQQVARQALDRGLLHLAQLAGGDP